MLLFDLRPFQILRLTDCWGGVVVEELGVGGLGLRGGEEVNLAK